MSASKPMSPLVQLYQPGEQFEISEAGLAAWRNSQAFDRAFSFYRNYPLQSLISDESRALLHHLVMMRRPKRILEIGTFVAGTTEVFARALWEAGHGHIDTIDPFGAERCPPIIAAFPNELRERITFLPVNSATHFDQEMGHNRTYDFVFIDGNHELEYALFDLLCTARLITPRGLVVLDNVDQSGPRLATKMFLQHFPEWNDVAGVVGKIDPLAPFAAPIRSFADTNFYLLEAPPHYIVREEPRSFGSADVDRSEVDGIELGWRYRREESSISTSMSAPSACRSLKSWSADKVLPSIIPRCRRRTCPHPAGQVAAVPFARSFPPRGNHPALPRLPARIALAPTALFRQVGQIAGPRHGRSQWQ